MYFDLHMILSELMILKYNQQSERLMKSPHRFESKKRVRVF